MALRCGDEYRLTWITVRLLPNAGVVGLDIQFDQAVHEIGFILAARTVDIAVGAHGAGALVETGEFQRSLGKRLGGNSIAGIKANPETLQMACCSDRRAGAQVV